jgi:hypothetical protein
VPKPSAFPSARDIGQFAAKFAQAQGVIVIMIAAVVEKARSLRRLGEAGFEQRCCVIGSNVLPALADDGHAGAMGVYFRFEFRTKTLDAQVTTVCFLFALGDERRAARVNAANL